MPMLKLSSSGPTLTCARDVARLAEVVFERTPVGVPAQVAHPQPRAAAAAATAAAAARAAIALAPPALGLGARLANAALGSKRLAPEKEESTVSMRGKGGKERVRPPATPRARRTRSRAGGGEGRGIAPRPSRGRGACRAAGHKQGSPPLCQPCLAIRARSLAPLRRERVEQGAVGHRATGS